MRKEENTISEAEARTRFLSALERDFTLSGIAELLTEERKEKCAALYLRLVAENQRYNLTAVTAPERAALLHFTDCVSAARLFPEGATVLDVGCGGGFPSLLLAIFRPDLQITAMDATAKKTAYVAESAAILGLAVKTLTCRAEEAAMGEMRETFDCVTARAVAGLPVLAELCLPFCKIGGKFIALKGATAAEERAEAANAVKLLGAEWMSETVLTVTDGEETLSRTAEIAVKKKTTPKEYPRPYAKILKKPL